MLEQLNPSLLPFAEYSRWQDEVMAKNTNIRRIRKWGDPIMVAQAGADVNKVGTTNFQAVGLYNKVTGWGGVTNFLRIPHADVVQLSQMQIEDEYVDKIDKWLDQKMRWLYKKGGTIYFAVNKSNPSEWNTAPIISWGTIALGGNLVQVEKLETIRLKLRGESKAADHSMAKLKGFHASDWKRPLAELLAEGLVHRCFCAYKNNIFGDTPKGIVYSPFYSPKDWDFTGTTQPDAFYLPEAWLE